MSEIAFRFAGKEYPLRLTMHRLRLMRDLAGIDLITGSKPPAGPEDIATVLYALAGGTKTGYTLEQFQDEVTPGDLRGAADLIASVFSRDSAGGGEGNAPVDAPTS
jgi:hypothetical protein